MTNNFGQASVRCAIIKEETEADQLTYFGPVLGYTVVGNTNLIMNHGVPVINQTLIYRVLHH